MSKYILIHERKGEYLGQNESKVMHEFDCDGHIDSVLDHVGDFLRGVGFNCFDALEATKYPLEEDLFPFDDDEGEVG